MKTVAISPKFQVVIPKEVRETMNLSSGMRVEIIPYEGRIELIPIRPLHELRGVLKGIPPSIMREEERI